MKVLLIAPFFENPAYPLYLPSENLGLGYLAAYLRANQVNVTIIDANMLELSEVEVATQAIEGKYELVGISVSFQLLIDQARRISKYIKESKVLK